MDAEEVIERICAHFGLTKDDIIAQDKSGYVSMARNFTYYFLHFEGEKISVSRIATIFGRSERGIKRILSNLKYLVATQTKFKHIYDEIKSSL